MYGGSKVIIVNLRFSKNQKKKRESAIQNLREKVQSRLKQKIKEKEERQQNSNYTPPRYDDVFFEGVKLLDELEGPSSLPKKGDIIVSDSVWKLRNESEVS